jgi:orotate phosphoribosyltransferase
MEKAISKSIPNVSVISPSPGGIMVAFGVREALGANQIYWAEMEDGKRQFRQYIGEGDIYPAIVVDDILRSGKAVQETVHLVKGLGAEVIGIGTIVSFEDAPKEFDGIPVKSLLSFDVDFYQTEDEWKGSRGATDAKVETVRF